jgi:hypothetical protein
VVKYYLPHIIFFSVFCVAIAPVIYYYQRRNPNPRCRPSLGEMTMVTIMALVVGGGASFLLGNVFRGDQNLRQFLAKPDEGAGWSRGTTGPSEDDEDDSRRGSGGNAEKD